MMNREIIPGRKRELDGVLYKLWPLQAPSQALWSKSVCRRESKQIDLAGRWLA